MNLKLFKLLRKELLGDLSQAFQNRDVEYQRLVEAFEPPDQTGISHVATQKIQSWVDWYNRLQGQSFSLRYYQILALYFTEHVLACQRDGKDFKDQKALVYWMATGSGKTLLMHMNILQFIGHIGGTHGFEELQIILTTPGVNLIQQHEQELGRLIQTLNKDCNNRISLTIATTAALLNKEPGFFNIPDRRGHYRLVLVDEGHIGLSGGGQEVGAFKRLRQDLLSPENSFLFEYSATYHGIAAKHVSEYADQIVFDYNYYRFFNDGYGKDFAIQSISDDRFADPGRQEYKNFMATFSCLAAKISDYYQLSGNDAHLNLGDGITRPLLAFMGNTVVDPAKEGTNDEVSDIRKLLRFLAQLNLEERNKLRDVFGADIQGRLRLTRQPGVSDLIWLSWGEGRIWGLINVGNGEKFAADCQGHEQLMDEQRGMLVEQARANIIQEHCFFEHIDRPESPINVLIGSRKFSEGWNCFRVSVIGLINLGSGKGNKIIQIFGRGVRLHGQNRDGKRRHPDHHGDYDSLAEEQNPLDRLRRLETLNIFSLKKSYLETFLKGVGKDLPVPMNYHIPLKPRPVVVRGSELPFEQYSPKLKAPRVGLKSFDSLLRIIRNSEDQNWTWEYLYEKGPEKQTINHFAITLDYSPGQDDHSQDIRHALYKWLERNQAFLPLSRWRTRMEAWEQRQKTQVLVQNNDGLLEKPDMLEVLSWPGRVGYIAGPEDRGFPAVISLTEQIQGDILNKVRNTIINDINKRKYRLDEILQQTTDDRPGDFAGWQNLHLSCKSESDRGRAKNKVTAKIRTIEKKLRLDLCEPKANYHIYGPLFDEKLKDELEKINILKFDGAYPPLLNSGESKFVRDLTKYLRQPAVRKSSYEFYLMRNEASMRSVGLYLQAQLQAFFPDFVLWIVEEKRPVTHILLIDPKGQTGILDPKTLETNEKVSIATNGHLDELAEKMTATHGRKFRLHSFILLRDSSLLGTCASIRPSSRELKIIENMQSKNVLRLDWSETKEDGSSTNALFNGKSYLDMMFEKAGILL